MAEAVDGDLFGMVLMVVRNQDDIARLQLLRQAVYDIRSFGVLDVPWVMDKISAHVCRVNIQPRPAPLTLLGD